MVVSAMANVVNLNKFRKRKAKAEREKRAETNRRLHGRTQAERQRGRTGTRVSGLWRDVRSRFGGQPLRPRPDRHGVAQVLPPVGGSVRMADQGRVNAATKGRVQ